eukprot:58965-Chlamydomonas_euryale.AAC.2
MHRALEVPVQRVGSRWQALVMDGRGGGKERERAKLGEKRAGKALVMDGRGGGGKRERAKLGEKRTGKAQKKGAH